MDEYNLRTEADLVNSPGQKNHALGITALVTGILGIILAICCSPLGALLGIVALVCGIIAAGRQLKFAVAGIVLGAIALGLGIIFSIFALPVLVLAFFEGFFEAIGTGY